MNFKEEQKEKVEKIEAILREYLPEANGYQSVIMEAMEYSLMAGGKRLRPMLMMETYRLFGGETEVIYPFMAAMEMIHTYSLVHDDLPAMDNDEYRRGRKTTHIVYGEDMGILAGDALLNYAFETACKAFEQFPEESLRIGQAMRVLAGKAGIYGMIGGQVVDVKESGHQIDEEVFYFQTEDRCTDRVCYDDWSNPCGSIKRRCKEYAENRRKDRNGIPDPGRYSGCDKHDRAAGQAGT